MHETIKHAQLKLHCEEKYETRHSLDLFPEQTNAILYDASFFFLTNAKKINKSNLTFENDQRNNQSRMGLPLDSDAVYCYLAAQAPSEV